jgi:FixJ family two-component response regulator
VLRLIVEGLPNRGIAVRLGIEPARLPAQARKKRTPAVSYSAFM